MTKLTITHFASFAVILLTSNGCVSEAEEEQKTAPPTAKSEPERKTHSVGQIGTDGRMALWVSKRGTSNIPFPLDDDYGVMLINQGGHAKPSALYVLGSRAQKKVWQTSDVREFERLTGSIPKGAKANVYDSCTVSLRHGLPDTVQDGFDRICKRLELNDEDRNITCVCASLD